MIHITSYKTRQEWLAARTSYIGGSDAACILGLNPWKSNSQLWAEKTGQAKPKDLADNPLVKYGTQAEDPLRQLFRLDFPDMLLEYIPDNMVTNDAYPFAHASLDGWMTDPDGRKGVLEIKTATISNRAQADKWKDAIPDNYYVQVLHYLMVTGFDFAIVKAQLKHEAAPMPWTTTRPYRIDRADVEQEIAYLAQKEAEFAHNIKTKTPPATILPEI